jgi:hypothetical protein
MSRVCLPMEPVEPNRLIFLVAMILPEPPDYLSFG